MIPTLPSSDPRPDERAARLCAAREVYVYDHESLAPLPLARTVPAADEPSAGWLARLAKLLVDIRRNTWNVGRGLDASRANALDLSTVVEALTSSRPGAARTVFAEITDLVMKGYVKGRPSGQKDYAALFASIDLPPIASTHHWDAVFAWMRVAGPDPMVMARIDRVPDHFPVTDAHLRAVLGDRDSLSAAAAEGRLYLCDYAVLDGVPLGTHQDLDQEFVQRASTKVTPKHLAAPLALFAVPAARGSAPRPLRPVAIQCGQRPGPGTPVFTPEDGWAWRMAKSLVQTADGHHHQVVAHFANTHMVVEPFVLATMRQLDRDHPLSVLLRPHFEGTLYINDSAQRVLLAPRGGVDLVMSTRIDISRGLAGTVMQSWELDDALPPVALRLRGVDDPEALPDYPYRDDALLVWKAVRAWVSDYLAQYYRSDADLEEDTELRAWAAEIRAEDGGRVKSFLPPGRALTREYLTDVVALVIFTAGPQHAAVNFPQAALMCFAPAMPLAAYRPPPASREDASMADYLDLLPPLDMAHLQRDLGLMLGSLRHTKLGEYEDGHFEDPRVQEPLATFQARLADIERTIEQRNTTRPAYEYLLPSLIPQSINI
jgi:arachidonate 15-lipoxygenase